MTFAPVEAKIASTIHLTLQDLKEDQSYGNTKLYARVPVEGNH